MAFLASLNLMPIGRKTCFISEYSYYLRYVFSCSYNKDEYIKPTENYMIEFSYVLAEPKGKYSPEFQFLQETHDVVEFVDCFSSIGLQYQSILPVKIKTKSCLGIFKRKKGVPVLLADKLINDAKIIRHFDNDDIESDIFEVEEQLEEIILSIPIRSQEIVQDVIDVEKTSIDDHLPEHESDDDRLSAKTARPPLRTKSKLKELIENHYLARGSIIETDKEAAALAEEPQTVSSKISAKTNIKRIIKAEKIKEMVEKISQLDLNSVCDLERLSTKDCLRKLIDEYDSETSS